MEITRYEPPKNIFTLDDSKIQHISTFIKKIAVKAQFHPSSKVWWTLYTLLL